MDPSGWCSLLFGRRRRVSQAGRIAASLTLGGNVRPAIAKCSDTERMMVIAGPGE